MKKLLLVLSLSACASLHNRVRDEVRVGDSTEKVQRLLGQPKEFGTADGVKTWTYVKGPDKCSVVFKDDVVKDTSCGENSKHKSFSQAFSEGFEKGRTPSQNLHCSSDYAGGANCR